MNSELLATIVGDVIDLLDRRIRAEGGHEIKLETKDFLADTLMAELKPCIPEISDWQNVLPFPGSPNTL